MIETDELHQEVAATTSRGQRRMGIRHRVGLVIGLLMLGLLAALCLGAPLVTQQDPTSIDPVMALLPPSAEHPFGTNQFGQDLLSRTLYAGRVDLLIGVLIVGIALVVGTTIGLISSWLGGWPDILVMRIVDIGFAFPFLVLVITMVGLIGPGLLSLIVAVSLVAWIFYARLVRTEVRLVKQQNYIVSARVSGFGSARILGRHVLPNVAPQLIVYATSDLVYAILLGASVSYLGLGVQPPTPEWGAMVQAGQNFIGSQWWISFFPGLAIAYAGIAFALIGDGLADALREGSGDRP
ncbi:MAG: ABC transporter permease [Propionibacteriales bacterium]|nr:ABC transporter permease [Propionibacteriales bacterium]